MASSIPAILTIIIMKYFTATNTLKPTCILTYPRSGSEVVMNYFSIAGLDSAGECLTNWHTSFHNSVDYLPKILIYLPQVLIYKQNAIIAGLHDIKEMHDSHLFSEHSLLIDQPDTFFYFNPMFDINNVEGRKNLEHWHNCEFKSRINILLNHSSPVIVKTFTSASFYYFSLFNFSLLFQNFDVIVLLRKDLFKTALSNEICNQLKTFHVFNSEDEMKIRDQLNEFKFNVGEVSFLTRLHHLNILKVIHDNINSFKNIFGDNHHAICYEDFADSPIEKLNSLLGRNVKPYEILHRKFIDDHESHILNLDKLKELYSSECNSAAEAIIRADFNSVLPLLKLPE